ncbi:MAG TPA: rRNA maturation RNase YbeY [Smithellaceae bacterium]|nr:rRNA maturation RNase YbeY [Smithellaceae bacterium]
MIIQIENRQKRVKIDKRQLRSMTTKLLKTLDCKDKEISITFVDNAQIQVINRDYLGKDRPTNVISFSLQEGDFGGVNPTVLGDIIISAETALADAEKGRLTLDEELAFLIIHGLLHLLGYNHEGTTPQEAAKMRKKEKELFNFLALSPSR